MSHRIGLTELVQVDPRRTRQLLLQLSVSDQASYRKILNGAHITQDCKHYCQESIDDVCRYCHCTYSRYHRFWQCPEFDACRSDVCPDLSAAIPTLPECVTAYGWAIRPSTFEEWYKYLGDVTIPMLPTILPSEDSVFHVFTDGSCANPQYPDLRYASWAVVWADPTQLCDSVILDSGPLSGIRQTSVRAELFAVHRAIRIAVTHQLRVMIWSDCQVVVRRLHRLLQGVKVRVNSPNADLWMLLENDLLSLADGRIQITKVSAHRSSCTASTALEEWCFRNNHFSDRAAAMANMRRPSEFWDLLVRHVQACNLVDSWNVAIQNVLLQVSRRVLQAETTAPVQIDEPPVEVQVPEWIPVRPSVQLPQGAVRWYGDHVVRSIVSWWWDVLSTASGPVLWVSHIQLFIDYTSSTGEIGPMNVKGWKNGSTQPLQGLRFHPFKRRVQWFMKVLKEILRRSQVVISCKYCRPESEMLAMFCGSVAVPWPKPRLVLVDKWLRSFSDQTFRRQSKALDGLPVAQRNVLFPEVFLTTCS